MCLFRNDCCKRFSIFEEQEMQKMQFQAVCRKQKGSALSNEIEHFVNDRTVRVKV